MYVRMGPFCCIRDLYSRVHAHIRATNLVCIRMCVLAHYVWDTIVHDPQWRRKQTSNKPQTNLKHTQITTDSQNYNRFTRQTEQSQPPITTPPPPGGEGEIRERRERLGPVTLSLPTRRHTEHIPLEGRAAGRAPSRGDTPSPPTHAAYTDDACTLGNQPLVQVSTPNFPMAPRTLRLPDSLGKTRLNAKP